MQSPLATWVLLGALVLLGLDRIRLMRRMKNMTDASNRLDDVTNRLGAAVSGIADRVRGLIDKLANVPADVSAQINADADKLDAAVSALNAIGSTDAGATPEQPVPPVVDEHVETVETPAPTDGGAEQPQG